MKSLRRSLFGDHHHTAMHHGSKTIVAVIAVQAMIIVCLLGVYQRQTLTALVTYYASNAIDYLVPLPDTFTLVDDDRPYFTSLPSGLTCYLAGTDLERSNATQCSCLAGYHGSDCGIPEPVWRSCQDCVHLQRRSTPRRLIHGINVNHELEFFQFRLEEIGDVIDVLIVGESNVTAGGEPSELYLLPELRRGFMGQFQHKIIHVFIDHFPPQGLTDGWFADTFIRDYMGEQGLQRIHGIREDDLFLLLDADELPDKRVLTFLKLYDGYPEPISLTLRWSVYGFFWKKGQPNEEQVTRVVAASSMRMIRQVYDGKVMSMRRNYISNDPLATRIMQYQNAGYQFNEWNIGLVGAYAGHHCSWCYTPEGIRLKLTSSQKDDKPRWGDYPEKLNLEYIRGLIRNGRWFDNSKPFFLVTPEQDPHYAPVSIWKHRDIFGYILDPPTS